MSLAQTYQGGHISHGDYWATFDGNNYCNRDRKRSRNNYYHRNYHNYNYINQQANSWEYGVNFNYTRPDQANYTMHDAIPLSMKRRKYSASTWEGNRGYYVPATIVHEYCASSCHFPVPPTRSSVDTSASEYCKLDISRFENGEPVFMSRDEIDRCSPSRRDGIDSFHETHLRYSYCAFLQNLGMRLDLPQTAIGTAMVLCHRFFVRRSHACHDRFLIATATLFLAAKSEETPRPLNNVLRESSKILHKQDFTLLSYLLPVDWFEQYRQRVLEAEQLILTTLNFELNVQHPYEPLTSILNKFGLSQTDLVNLALSIVSEGVFTRLACWPV